MDRNEEKLRARLARAKGGHRKVLQRKLDRLVGSRATVETPEAPAPAPTIKKPARKKTSKKK